jgi:hypothetical protein
VWDRVSRPQPRHPLQDAAEQLARHRHLAIWKIAYRPWAITFAPIFTTFSRRLVSDHRATSPGRARVRRKLARL